MKKLIFIIVIALALTMVPGFLSTGIKTDAATTTSAFQKVSFTNGTVTTTALNVRQGPSTGYKVVCTLKKGQTVKIFGKLGAWYAVMDTAKGCVGCVSSKFISTGGTAATTGTPKTTTPPVATTPGTNTASNISTDEQAMLSLINKARIDAGVSALTFDSGVQKCAVLKAEDMVNKNYFSHQSPTYGSPFDMMRQFGVNFKSAGENIAGNQTVQRAFDAWMNSPGHKQNILNGSYNFTGIGVVNSPTYGKVFVQQFIGR